MDIDLRLGKPMDFILTLSEDVILAIVVLAVMLVITLLLQVSFTWLVSMPYGSPETGLFIGMRESVENQMVTEHYRCLRTIWAMCLIAAGLVALHGH